MCFPRTRYFSNSLYLHSNVERLLKGSGAKQFTTTIERQYPVNREIKQLIQTIYDELTSFRADFSLWLKLAPFFHVFFFYPHKRRIYAGVRKYRFLRNIFW
ncbi:hypothetical protein CW304_09280 [Bacillus sp. UFRGS-B20]|nr:hypothetical protein CW304_09280 [Bacillus sp. UFRGS-B20]